MTLDAIAPALLATLTDPQVFGRSIGGPTWAAWRAFVHALLGVVPNEPGAVETILKHTGRTKCPPQPAREAWVIVGRRGGKSRVISLFASLVSCFRDYSEYLAGGERAIVMVIAADRKQARVVLRYIVAIFETVPMLRAMIESRTKEAIHLTNGVSIEVHTCNFRSVRGYTCAAVIADEVAFWSSDEAGANPDVEVLNALRPALATIPGAPLIAISTPYARRGELWRVFHDHFGQDDDPILVWQSDSLGMNPTIDRAATIDPAYAADEAMASAEWGAQFRRDLEQFVSREVIDRVVMPDRRELPPLTGIAYRAFCDPSGGASDSMTLAIAHDAGGRAIVDLAREVKAPFNPDAVTADFAMVLKRYGVRTVTGDRYAGEWPRDRFRAYQIDYRPSEKTKSELYADLLPLLNAGRVELLDLPRLKSQLLNLERRTSRGGKDSIDHAPRQKDDVVNAVAGVVTQALKPKVTLVAWCLPAYEPREPSLALQQSRTAHERRQRDANAAAQAARFRFAAEAALDDVQYRRVVCCRKDEWHGSVRQALIDFAERSDAGPAWAAAYARETIDRLDYVHAFSDVAV